MKWHLGNIVVRVKDATLSEQDWIGGYLSYAEKSYRPGKRRYEEKRVSLYNTITGEFPAGLARQTWVEAGKQSIAVEVIDDRVCPCQPDPSADLEWLRHHPAVQGDITHQIAAVEAAVKYKRGIIWSPVASGKTDISVGISKVLPCTFLFLVHRTSLLLQTAERYHKRTGLYAGVIGDGKIDVPADCRFVVASFQTMHSALRRKDKKVLDILRSAGGLIVDEVHCLPAKTFLSVVRHAANAYYRFGLSGTPLARDQGRNLALIGGLGPVIFRVQPDELIKIGLLADPAIRMVEVRQQVPGNEWIDVYDAGVVRSALRNGAVADIVRRAAKPCLVFVSHVEHGKRLLASLTRAGIGAEFVWGDKDTPQRQAAVERLVRGDTEALICSVIFQEGIDVPSLRSVVVATGGASAVAAVQRIGRGMRSDAETDKDTCEVWDIFDKSCGCTLESGPTHSGCRWLEKHSRARMRAYKGEGFEVEVVISRPQSGPEPTE